jgi:NADPH:quinone reductase-like Zn-dependent oxidoreductase
MVMGSGLLTSGVWTENDGSYRQFLCRSVDTVVQKPDHLTIRQASACSTPLVMAYGALQHHSKVPPTPPPLLPVFPPLARALAVSSRVRVPPQRLSRGELVVVLGSQSAVGQAALQIAR